jgi:hypothetical protein
VTADIADRMAMVEVLAQRIKAMREQLNEEASALKAGTRLPGFVGDTELGALVIPKSSESASVTDETALYDEVAEKWPEKIVSVIKPSWFGDERLVNLARKHLPEAVTQIVRPSYVDELLGYVAKFGGNIDDSGEVVPVPGMKRNPGGKPLSPRVNLDADIKQAAATPGVPLPAGITEATAQAILGTAAYRMALDGHGDG